MKKLAITALILATLAGNGAYAQTTKQKMGTAAQSGKTYSFDYFAWGIGLGSLAVLGIVVGLTVGAAVGDPPSH